MTHEARQLPQTPQIPVLNLNEDPHAVAWRNAVLMLTEACFKQAKEVGWWNDLETGEPIKPNVGELLMLCVSELAEAMEGHRKSLPDDKLPKYDMLTVELADCLIRIFDMAGGLKLPLAAAFADKMAYNKIRTDHKLEARRTATGKKY